MVPEMKKKDASVEEVGPREFDEQSGGWGC